MVGNSIFSFFFLFLDRFFLHDWEREEWQREDTDGNFNWELGEKFPRAGISKACNVTFDRFRREEIKLAGSF